MKHCLTLKNLGAETIFSILDRALYFKKNRQPLTLLNGKVFGLIFEKESTRTRISFEVAMQRLGGTSIYLSQSSSQISRGETYADTARVLSRYLDALVLRAYSQADLEELASHASIPVINGLTDDAHPCQVLADLMTILEKKGKWDDLKIAYIGDGNNMTNTWIEAALLLNFNLHVACPKGYGPSKELVSSVKGIESIGLTSKPLEAVAHADVINTDTWFSMGQKVSQAKRKKFKGFQINRALLQKASPDVIVLHCLPAHRG